MFEKASGEVRVSYFDPKTEQPSAIKPKLIGAPLPEKKPTKVVSVHTHQTAPVRVKKQAPNKSAVPNEDYTLSAIHSHAIEIEQLKKDYMALKWCILGMDSEIIALKAEIQELKKR